MSRTSSVVYYLSWGLLILILFIAVFGGWIKPHGLTAANKISLKVEETGGKPHYSSPPFRPNDTFLLGSDHRGFDVLSLLLNGLKYTLGIALLLTALRFAFALPWGLWAGTTGKGRDLLRSLQWIISAVPAFLFLYPPLAGIYFGLQLNQGADANPDYMLLFIVFFVVMVTFIGVFPLANLLADRARFYNDKLFVDVSRLMGSTNRHRMIRHILPNMRLELIYFGLSEFVQILFLMGQLAFFRIMIGGSETLEWDDVGTEIILSKSGEWNSMLAYGSTYIQLHPWIILSAGLSLTLLILSLQFFLGQLKKRHGSV